VTVAVDLLTTPQVCAITGASYRQIDYWARTGMVSPDVEAAGSGSRRGWHPDQLPKIKALAVLSHALYGYKSSLMRELAAADADAGPWQFTANGVLITIHVL
jgi:DNA-binding transcriptional MerR regulator